MIKQLEVVIVLTEIKFVTQPKKLIEMAYSDTIYAWLLLHSHYDPDEHHNYIYKKDFTYRQIAKDIGRNEKTVSKRFKELLALSENVGSGRDLIWYDENSKAYILPNFQDFQKLDAQTVLNLFRLSSQQSRREELVKTYAWLRKEFETHHKEISYADLIVAFGHAFGNQSTYDRYKDILTTLQGAGLIKFRTDLDNHRNSKGQFDKTLYVYKVEKKASKEWLDKEYGTSK